MGNAKQNLKLQTAPTTTFDEKPPILGAPTHGDSCEIPDVHQTEDNLLFKKVTQRVPFTSPPEVAQEFSGLRSRGLRFSKKRVKKTSKLTTYASTSSLNKLGNSMYVYM